MTRRGGSRDVLCFARGQRHHLLLHRLPAHWTPPKEEEHTRGALARINVTGHVTIAVADETRTAVQPRVAASVLNGARHVSEDPLHRRQMLSGRLLHEAAHIADRERKVRSSM